MAPSTNLDLDLALTEISIQSASIAKGLRDVILENSKRISMQYPQAGLGEEEIAGEFASQLEKRGITLSQQGIEKNESANRTHADGSGHDATRT